MGARRRSAEEVENDQMVRAAWERGLLSYKLTLPNPQGGDWSHQFPVYDAYWRAINDKETLKYVANVSRRFGKSFIACLIAFEFCLRTPDRRVKIACPTQGQMSKIIEEVTGPLLADCPPDLLPKFHWGRYTFKNGSTLQLAGADGLNSDRLRGTSSDLVFVDEAAFVSDLKYLLSSILLPTMLKSIGSTLICYSTPASATDHYFTELVQEAQADGRYLTLNINDDPTMTPELRARYAKEYGGEDTTEFRREYLCEFCTDTNIQVVQEWHTVAMTFPPDKDEQYPYYHKYVSLDIGIRDNTAAIFGYYDYKQATLVIEDEWTMAGNTMTTQIIADAISEKEEQLWSSCHSPHSQAGGASLEPYMSGRLVTASQLPMKRLTTAGNGHLPSERAGVNDSQVISAAQASSTDKVYRRVGDTSNLLLLQDLSKLHGMAFTPVKKGTLYNMVNALKLLLSMNRLQVHPRCEMLIGCLESAYWNREHSAFAHSKRYSHFDHLAALIYLVISLDEHTNPLPSVYGANGLNVYYRSANQGVDAGRLALANALLGKRG